MKRYESSYEYHPADYGYPSGKMELSYNGDYVLYDDYAKEVGQKDTEIAALKAKYRDLENDYVATESIYEAICDMVTTGKEPSDFMMSFPSVREMWDAINSKDAEIAALKEKIKGLEELQYVYENTPFAHWMERTKKAEAYKSDVENAKYKAFWDDSRLADRQQWERYDWPKHQKEDSQ